jgi:hypothetical protein
MGWDRTVGGWDSRTLGSAGRPFKDSNVREVAIFFLFSGNLF